MRTRTISTTLIPQKFKLGESPFWNPKLNSLNWIDIEDRKLYTIEMSNLKLQSLDLPEEPGCIAPLISGDMLIAMRDGIYMYSGQSKLLKKVKDAPYQSDIERFNDGKCDARGRLWTGTVFEPKTSNLASLYCFQQNTGTYTINKIAQNNMTANGLAFSPDHLKMYWSNTPEHRIDVFDFDVESGHINNRRIFKQFPAKGEVRIYGGRPDGACVDQEGCYWVAMYEGGRVLRLASDATVLEEIKLPVKNPTMTCLGGVDGRRLFITTASKGLTATELLSAPLSGCIFMTDVDVPGLPVNYFSE